MSISSETRKAGPYAGNGVTTNLPFSFKVFSTSDVRVVQTDPVGAETDLTLTTHYTVSMNADQDANPGGTVVMVTAPATGYYTTLASKVQNLQTVTITNLGGFYPKILNDALDRLTIMVQQVAEQVSRAVKVGISSSSTPDQLIDAINTAASTASAAAASASGSAGAASSSAASAAASAASAGGKLPKDGSEAMTGNLQMGAGTAVIFEGTTDDAYETTLTAEDPTADRLQTLPNISGQVAVQARGADIASASTINLTTATGDIVDVTGTTAITAITLADGLERQVRFTGVLTLTNDAGLDLPGGANITTAAGDRAVFRGYAGGVVRCMSYTKANGQAVVGAGGITLGTAVSLTTQTAIDYTGLPAGIKRLTISFQGVSTNGTDRWIVQIGNTTFTTTGYVGHANSGAGINANSSGFEINNNVTAANNYSGQIVITKVDTNTYAQSGVIASQTTSNSLTTSGGSIALASELERVRITTTGGTNQFDAGKVNIAYE